MIIEIYRDEEIRYDVDINQWQWNGKSYPGLKNAREAIDRSQREDFTRIDAIWRNWHNFASVSVTSLTDDGRAWVIEKEGKKRRHKVYPRDLYQESESNRQRLKEVEILNHQVEALTDRSRTILSSMESFTVPLSENS